MNGQQRERTQDYMVSARALWSAVLQEPKGHSFVEVVATRRQVHGDRSVMLGQEYEGHTKLGRSC